VDDAVAELFDAVQRLHDEDATVVTSVRLSSSLREAVKAAVKAGMDANPNDAMLNAVRDRLEAFTQRLALDLHYERHPDARPSLAEIAIAAAQLDDSPLAHDLLRRAADEVVRVKPDADADDVLVYAAALQAALGPTSPAAAAS
jgi:predicted DsbA family dithiol-disulfide isomerase